jgi:hypothetical protein
MLSSVARTAAQPDSLEVILYLDRDDPQSHQINHPTLKLIKLVGPRVKMGHMTHACYAASSGRILMLANDDLYFRTRGWDLLVRETVERTPDQVCLIWGNDLLHRGRFPTHPILTRTVCELMGGVCPQQYDRDYIDTHIYDVFVELRRLGHDRMVYLPDVIFEHMHVEAGKAFPDATSVKLCRTYDEQTFIAWAEERQLAARRLARRIGFCYLQDQLPLTDEAFRRARGLCERVRALVAEREEYIRRHCLSREIHLPHGNWELGTSLYAAYLTVVDGDYTIINNLRLFSQVFTGYALMSLSREVGPELPREVPPDLDEHLARLAGLSSPEVARYLETIAHLPTELHITPPRRFGEIGWVIDGKIVNHDTNVYLERLALLAETGMLSAMRGRGNQPLGSRDNSPGRPCILEIGSGYGGLAHYLRTLIPDARYYLVDIPESLLFAAIYLSTIWEQSDNVLVGPENIDDLKRDTPGFTFVPSFLFDECCRAGLKIDLAINTLSMSEMTEQQVRYYCERTAELLGEEGIFFEQNHDNRRLGMLDAKTIIAEHFPWCTVIRPAHLRPTQGEPHLWTVDPAQAELDWRPSAEALRPLPEPTWPRRQAAKVSRAVTSLFRRSA